MTTAIGKGNKMRKWMGILSAVLALSTGVAGEIKVKGYAFGDYYYVASGTNKEQNGFQIRRIYLTADKPFNERFSSRVRLEANDAGFGANAKMTTAIKDAYLKYKKDGRSVVIGLSPTPTWSLTEKIWGYRSIEKTIIDLNKVGSSRDLGILAETRLDADGKASVQVMFGNGNSNKSEVDNGKKAYLRLDLRPTSAFGASIYADYESRPADQDRTSLGGLLYTSSKGRAFGLEGIWQNRKNAVAGADIAVRGLSLFGRAKVDDRYGFFGRVDYYDPNDSTGDDAVTRMFAGVDITPHEDVHIMPNVIVESYQDSAVDTVLIPRVTVYFIF